MPSQAQPERARRTTHPTLEAYQQLLQRVRSGTYAPGSQLPSERRLSTDLGVSRATLRQALTALAHEGLLDAIPQRGWFVPDAVLTEPNILLSFTELAREQGRTPSAKVLVDRTRPASLDEADRLAVPPTSPIREVERLRLLDDVAVCVEVNRLPLARLPQMESVDLSGSLYALLAEHTGREATRAEFAVHAEPANRRTANLLGASDGVPVLIGEERTFDRNSDAVLLGTSTYRWEAYRFEATLYRKPDSA
jgi:GntR family transcriptional regulator